MVDWGGGVILQRLPEKMSIKVRPWLTIGGGRGGGDGDGAEGGGRGGGRGGGGTRDPRVEGSDKKQVVYGKATDAILSRTRAPLRAKDEDKAETVSKGRGHIEAVCHAPGSGTVLIAVDRELVQVKVEEDGRFSVLHRVDVGRCVQVAEDRAIVRDILWLPW